MSNGERGIKSGEIMACLRRIGSRSTPKTAITTSAICWLRQWRVPMPPGWGRLRKRKIKHAKPVTAAIVLWNTVYLERATSALRAHGKALDDTLLQYLSPLGWEHINLTGDYLWRSSAKVGAGKFRPLRPLPPA